MENTCIQREHRSVHEVGAVRIYQVAWRTGRHVLQSSSEPTLSVLHSRPSCPRPHKLDYTFSDYDIISLWNISPHILFDFSLLICSATYGGCFFYYYALKMTKCQLLKISFYGRNKKKTKKEKSLSTRTVPTLQWEQLKHFNLFVDYLLKVDTNNFLGGTVGGIVLTLCFFLSYFDLF